MNPAIFGTSSVLDAPVTNDAGGVAYSLTAKQALAQMAVTGCFNNGFYASADVQFDRLKALLDGVPPEYAAKVAVYARQSGYMKDMPAVILAWLAVKGDAGTVASAFPRVIDNGKMLRNFVQAIRSKSLGRKSFPHFARRLIRDYLNTRKPLSLWRDNIGEKPSIGDVIRMVHPKPVDDARAALFRYMLGCKRKDGDVLPGPIEAYEAFKQDPSGAVPDADFRYLTALPLTDTHWRQIAKSMNYMATRMNLNALAKHGVFSDPEIVEAVASRLSNREELVKARQFPYQLFTAIRNVGAEVPSRIKVALGAALDHSLTLVPPLGGKVMVFVDVSGSMDSPVTGERKPGQTTVVSCKQVAALFAAVMVKTNPDAVVYGFSYSATRVTLNPRDPAETMAAQIAALPSGCTSIAAPLDRAIAEKQKADTVIWLSDNESWNDSPCHSRGTRTAELWRMFKRENRGARAVMVDLAPNAHAQLPSGLPEVLHVGGFSDAVFDVIRHFGSGEPDAFVKKIEETEL